MADKDRSGRESVSLLALLTGAGIYLYANLFRWPNTPYLLGGDQVFFWTDAQRMLHGERIYQDFFRFTPPGVDLVYLTSFRLFGTRLWVTNAIVLVLGMALCWVCFSVASQLMSRIWAALGALLFLVLIYGPLLNGTHHWFSLLATMTAVRVLMPQRTSCRLVIAGALLGIASFFTQTAGVACLVGLAVFVVLELRRSKQTWRAVLRREFLVLVAFVAVVGALNSYYIVSAGWRPMWQMLVVYPHYLTYWFGRYFPGLPDTLTMQTLPRLTPTLALYIALPVTYPLAFWRCWRRRGEMESNERWAVILLSLMGFALLLEILPAVNWLRIYAVSMPGVILLAWAASQLKRPGRAVAVAGWMLVALIAGRQIWSKHRANNRVLMLPAGNAALPAQKSDGYRWIMSHSRPGDFFFPAQWPGIYLPLDLRNPVFVDSLLTNDWTRPEYVVLAVRQLEAKRVEYILWSPRSNGPDDPARHWEDHLGPMRTYLLARYKRVHVFADGDEIWQLQ
jgi:hypothetical protein